MNLEAVNIHPSAIVDSKQIGVGTQIWAFVHVMEGASIGSHCKLGDHVFVESGAVIGDRVTIKNSCLIWHGVNIGDDVFVGPNVVFTNDLMPRAHKPTGPEAWMETRVEDGVSIGANSTVVCGITIGRHAMVGAGSVVTRDVSAHELVVGNPARIVGWVCSCGEKLPSDQVCASCGREYRTGDRGLEERSDA